MTARRERFRRMYDATYGPVLGYVRRRTDTLDDAHDVVSETFLTAWRRLEEVPEGDRARLWLFGTARRLLANHHRGRRRRQRLADRLQVEFTSTDGGGADGSGAADRQLIAQAFDELHETDQEVLILAGWEQLDAGQIAEVLGCARTTARVRLHRARRRFAAGLADRGVQTALSPGRAPSGRAAVRPRSEDAR